MFECRHNSDEANSGNFSESQQTRQFCAALDLSLHIESQSETAVENPFVETRNSEVLTNLETDCLDGICSLTWTPGTRH
jgi:hypothetical protein